MKRGLLRFGLAMAVPFCVSMASFSAPAPVPEQKERTRTVLIGFPWEVNVSRRKSALDAAQLAVDDANKKNIRIKGEKVFFKLFVADDKNSPNMAILAAHAMVAAGVVGVVGHLTTDTSIAAAKIYSDAGIPQISPTATGRPFTQLGYRTVFQLLGHSDITSMHLADSILNTIKAKRVMLIDNDTVLGRSLVTSVNRELVKRGGAVAATDTINALSSDFVTSMAKIKDAAVDVVLFASVVPQTIEFSRRMRQLGNNQALLLAGGAINPEFPDAGEYAEGTWLLVSGLPPEKIPGLKSLEKRYKENFTTSILPQSLFVYDAVGVLIEAMRHTDSLDPSKLVRELHEIKYNGISGVVSFDREGSLNSPPYTLYQVRQKKWITVRVFP